MCSIEIEAVRRELGLPGSVRIIAGEWRRRRLPVPDELGLRPTSDRIRETLFNWLGPRIEGMVCADLFAGSGALGLEAASRGASKVYLIERNARVVRHLHTSVAALSAPQCEVVSADAMAWLTGTPPELDLVFVDPPFQDRHLLAQTIENLAPRLTPGARVYIESDKSLSEDEIPSHWEMLRCAKAGQVRYHLVQVTSSERVCESPEP